MIFFNDFEDIFDYQDENANRKEENEAISIEKDNTFNINQIREQCKTINIEIKSTNFSSNNSENIIKGSKTDLTPALKKKRERTEPENNEVKHNKFSDDNMRRKCKHIILQEVMNFINKKISEIYRNNIGQGIFVKKLLIINQKQIINSSILFNKYFLDKTLGEIFSENISSRFTNYPLDHNKKIITLLIKDEDEEKKNYFINLFNLKFIDCIKHFRESCFIPELEGLINFKDLNLKSKMDEDYYKALNCYINNFENILFNKKERNKFRMNKF